MAARFPHPTNAFIEVEQLIRYTFEIIITTATEKRDQLLAQLNDMKLNYLNKEETRKKQVCDIQELILQVMKASIEQNPIVRLQIEQLENLEEEQKKFEKPTPVPLLDINIEGLESLLGQLRGFGAVVELGELYRERINPIRQFGEEGDKRGGLNCPSGLALYKDESIYIADTFNQRIQVFSTAGKFLSEFGEEQLSRPHSIAVYDKWVFVSDSFENAVFKFQITKNKFVCQSDIIGEFNFLSGITVDTGGEVLVADSRNNRIAVLNLELKLVREIGNGKLKSPMDVKTNNNNIFVADNNEINNIHMFTKGGDMIRSFIKLDNGTGNISFCFDLNNNIVVSDFVSNSIQIFSIEGLLIHKIFCEISPFGIAINSPNNIICVCHNGIVSIY